MSEELQTTSVLPDAGSAGTGEYSLDVPSNEPAAPAITGTVDLAPADQSADLQAIITGIPADDTDLTPTDPHYQAMVAQRGNLRTLSAAFKELEPLRGYSELGPISTIQPKVELANKLYSPMVDAQGQPVLDPATRLPSVTTLPFVQYLDQNSSGMPEQLLADLLDFETVDGTGNRRKMSLQVLDYWDGRYPNWWKQRYGSQIAPSYSSGITDEELAEIPKQYHDGYRLIPPSIRHALSAYDEADRTRLLEDYKAKADQATANIATAEANKQREAEDAQRLQQHVFGKQREYLQTIRKERFSALSQSLSKRFAFSDDQGINTVMHGVLGTAVANLTDPDVDFIAKEQILAPLGISLDQKFYSALNSFYVNAANKVAYEIAGDTVQSATSEREANAAADQLSARLAVIALQIAAKMGSKQAEEAAKLGASLGTTSRPAAGTAAPPTPQVGQLPTGVRVGSVEALNEIARRTNFVTG